MDPLTVTLAAVTLATALKDITELGKKIHASFSRVSGNLRNLQGIAEDIKEMLDDIANFCELNCEALENAIDLRRDLQTLVCNLKRFESKVLPLIDRSAVPKRLDQLMRTWDLWRKRAIIEASIRELRHEVKKIVRRHTMMGAIRTQMNTERIHRGFERVQRDIDYIRATATSTLALRDPTTLTPSSVDLETNMIMFASSSTSTSMPMLRTPEVITDEIISTAYITFQISKILKILENINFSTVTESSRTISTALRRFELSPSSPIFSMPIQQLRRYIIREVTFIHDILESVPSDTSITDGATCLSSLAFGLSHLMMSREAVLIQSWSIKLTRIIAYTNKDDPTSTAELALLLVNNSIYSQDIGDAISCLDTIEEGYLLTRRLPNSEHFQILRSNAALRYAVAISAVRKDSSRPLDLARESAKIMEDIIGAPSIICMDANIVGSIDPYLLEQIFASTPSPMALTQYGRAQEHLGICLGANWQLEEALRCLMLSVEIFRHMCTAHTSEEFGRRLASALRELIESPAAVLLDATMRLSYANECAELFRNLCTSNPAYYTTRFISALYSKADILYDLNMDDEALTAEQEAVMLSKQLVQDATLYSDVLSALSDHFRRLKRYNDAAASLSLAVTTYQAPEEIQAERFYHLCHDFAKMGRWEDSAQAARKSVALYRTLALSDRGRWAEDLGWALSALVDALIITGDLVGACKAGDESIELLDN